MAETKEIERAPRELVEPFWDFGTAAVSSALREACGGVLVMPGDIIVGDDDGVVVVPPKVAPQVIEYCHQRETREVFERIKLKETGDIEKYYPFDDEGQAEYEQWLRETGRVDPMEEG